MKSVSYLTSFFSLLILIALGLPAAAELADGSDVPRVPSKPDERRMWTVSGVERYHLPVLTEGVGKGYHAYYHSRGKYRAYITEDGALEIEMLDRDDKVVGERFDLGGALAGAYTITNEHGRPESVPRYMIRTKSEYKPQDNPRNKLILEAILEDEAELKRTYEFTRDMITVVTGLKCSNVKKSRASMGASFRRLATFPPHVKQSEREAQFKGYEVEIRHVQGRKKETVTYEYAKSAKLAGKGLADEAKVTGPWGEGRSLELKTKEPVMRPYIYSGACPYEGYSFSIHVPEGTYSSFDYKLQIKIN